MQLLTIFFTEWSTITDIGQAIEKGNYKLLDSFSKRFNKLCKNIIKKINSKKIIKRT